MVVVRLPNTTYYVFKNTSLNFANIRLCLYDADKGFINAPDSLANATITMSSNAHYVRFYVRKTSGSASYNGDISINYPSTDHDYHAYDGNTYTTTLGRTVYGGTLDVVSGELVVDRAMVDLGTLTYTKYDTTDGTLFRSSAISDSAIVSNMGYPDFPINVVCSNYECVANNRRANGNLSCGVNKRVDIIDNAYTDASAFKTAMNGVQLCYELATPQTYQLDPQTISLLHGNNNVWSDGEVELTYNADVGLYIDKKLGTSDTRTLSMTRTLAKSEDTDDTKSVQLAEDIIEKGDKVDDISKEDAI